MLASDERSFEEYDALPRDSPASFPTPSVFGRYRVAHQLGVGVLGPVFRAYDPDRDRTVAIKAFLLDLVPEQATELAAEFDRLATLKIKHAFTILPYAGGVEGTTAFLAQEYFIAESADVAVKQYGPPPVQDALRLIGQLAGALDAAAAAGVHHGALHLRDVLLARNELRLTGLGVVPALEQVGFHPQARRPCAAPERLAGQAVTHASDIFSLACLTFELLTGRRPVPSGDGVTVDASAIPAADVPALSEAFERVLSPRPEDRHPSALAFAAALKHALTGEPLQAGVDSAPLKPRRAPRARRVDVLPFDEEPAPAPVAAIAEEPLPAPTPAPAAQAEVPAVVVEPPAPEPAPVAVLAEVPAAVVEPPTAIGEPTPAVIEEPAAAVAEEPTPAVIEGPVAAVAEEPTAPALPEEPTIAVTVARSAHAAAPIREEVAPPPEVEAVEPTSTESADVEYAAVGVRLAERPAARIDIAEPAAAAKPGHPSEVEFDSLETEEEPAAESAPVADEAEPPAAEEAEEPSFALAAPDPFAEYDAGAPPARRMGPLLGMLAVGLVVGFVAGYFAAPRGARGPDDVKATAPAAPAVPAAAAPAAAPTSTSTPAARPPAQAAAPAAPTTPAPAPAKTAVGTLVVASKPSGARVFIDGRDAGATPLTVRDVKPGLRRIRIELDGYRSWTTSVRIAAARQRKVTASLERRPGG